MALRQMKNAGDAIPALQRVLKSDNYAHIRVSESFRDYDSRTMVYSPVRDAAAEVIRLNGVNVPRDVEVVPAKFGVERVEHLLYDSTDPQCSRAVTEILGMMGGVEAEIALQTFVEKQTGKSEVKSLVWEAEVALRTMKTVQSAA